MCKSLRWRTFEGSIAHSFPRLGCSPRRRSPCSAAIVKESILCLRWREAAFSARAERNQLPTKAPHPSGKVVWIWPCVLWRYEAAAMANGIANAKKLRSKTVLTTCEKKGVQKKIMHQWYSYSTFVRETSRRIWATHPESLLLSRWEMKSHRTHNGDCKIATQWFDLLRFPDARVSKRYDFETKMKWNEMKSNNQNDMQGSKINWDEFTNCTAVILENQGPVMESIRKSFQAENHRQVNQSGL